MLLINKSPKPITSPCFSFKCLLRSFERLYLQGHLLHWYLLTMRGLSGSLPCSSATASAESLRSAPLSAMAVMFSELFRKLASASDLAIFTTLTLAKRNANGMGVSAILVDSLFGSRVGQKDLPYQMDKMKTYANNNFCIRHGHRYRGK